MLGINLNNETKVGLLYVLEAFTKQVTGDMLLPVKRQSKDTKEPAPRQAAVFKARLSGVDQPGGAADLSRPRMAISGNT
ncbi:MAG: hypothetical protein K2N78_08640 [Oscillospiraceae bacterium]|nr:hypothetical protein [Oscillospiraceae bacterium]